MARFIRFPGVAGSYVDTDDVNLLDADTAHIFQSVGKWQAQQVGSSVWSNAEPSFMGGNSLLITSLATGQNRIDSNLGGLAAFPVVVGETFTISVYVERKTASAPNLTMNVQFAGGIGNQLDVPWPVSGKGWISASFVVPVGATSVSFILFCTAVAAGEDWWFGGSSWKQGASGTFIPSLRIVGDLEISGRMSTPVVPPVDQRVLTAQGVPASFGSVTVSNTDGSFVFQRRDSSDAVFGPISLLMPLTASKVQDFKLTHTVSDSTWKAFVDGLETDSQIVGGVPAAHAGGIGVGAYADGVLPWIGDGFFVTYRDGIGGPIVARFDAEDLGI